MQECYLLYSSKMIKYIIKFYRYVKYFIEVISIHFLLNLLKGEIKIAFSLCSGT